MNQFLENFFTFNFTNFPETLKNDTLFIFTYGVITLIILFGLLGSIIQIIECCYFCLFDTLRKILKINQHNE